MSGGATFDGMIVGTLNWDGGSLTGVLTVPAHCVFNIVQGGGNGLNGLLLTNNGTVTWSNTTIYGLNSNNARIYNYGLRDAQSDNTFVGGYSGGQSIFYNIGTFRKSNGTGATTLDTGVAFNNTGIVRVATGSVNIGGGTSSGGTFTTVGAMIVNFVGAPYHFTNSTQFVSAAGHPAIFSGTIEEH